MTTFKGGAVFSGASFKGDVPVLGPVSGRAGWI